MYLCVYVYNYFIFLLCNGKSIKWDFIKDLYKRNAGRPGYSMAYKIKHIKLTNFSKMRVDLAAEVSILDNVYKIIQSMHP